MEPKRFCFGRRNLFWCFGVGVGDPGGREGSKRPNPLTAPSSPLLSEAHHSLPPPRRSAPNSALGSIFRSVRGLLCPALAKIPDLLDPGQDSKIYWQHQPANIFHLFMPLPLRKQPGSQGLHLPEGMPKPGFSCSSPKFKTMAHPLSILQAATWIHNHARTPDCTKIGYTHKRDL